MNETERSRLVSKVVEAMRFLEELDSSELGSDYAIWRYAFETKEEADQELSLLSDVAHHAGIENLDLASVPGDDQDPAESGKWMISVILEGEPEPA